MHAPNIKPDAQSGIQFDEKKVSANLANFNDEHWNSLNPDYENKGTNTASAKTEYGKWKEFQNVKEISFSAKNNNVKMSKIYVDDHAVRYFNETMLALPSPEFKFHPIAFRLPDEVEKIKNKEMIPTFYGLTFSVPKQAIKQKQWNLYFPGTEQALEFSTNNPEDEGFNQSIDVTMAPMHDLEQIIKALSSRNSPKFNLPQHLKVGSLAFYKFYATLEYMKLLINEMPEIDEKKKAAAIDLIDKQELIMKNGLILAGWTRENSNLYSRHMLLDAPYSKKLRQNRMEHIMGMNQRYGMMRNATRLANRKTIMTYNPFLEQKIKLYLFALEKGKLTPDKYKDLNANAKKVFRKSKQELFREIQALKPDKINDYVDNHDGFKDYQTVISDDDVLKHFNLALIKGQSYPVHQLRNPKTLEPVLRKDVPAGELKDYIDYNPGSNDFNKMTGACFWDMGRVDVGVNNRLVKTKKKKTDDAGQSLYRLSCATTDPGKWVRQTDGELMENRPKLANYANPKNRKMMDDYITKQMNPLFAVQDNQGIMSANLDKTKTRIVNRWNGTRATPKEKEPKTSEQKKADRMENLIANQSFSIHEAMK